MPAKLEAVITPLNTTAVVFSSLGAEQGAVMITKPLQLLVT